MTVTITFALAAALANAVHLMTQHAASVGVSNKHRGWDLVAFLIRQPLWLLGWAAAAGGFAFQAVAIHSGQLSVVQTLLVTEFGLRPGPAPVLGPPAHRQDGVDRCAGHLCVSGGFPDYGRAPWRPPAARRGRLGFCAGRLRRDCRRVGGHGALGVSGASGRVYATAASITWALMAAFIKATTNVLAAAGPVGMLAHWPITALIASAVLGSVLQQAALQVGPLSVSQPLIVVVDPAVAIVLSIWIFDERFTVSVAQKTIAGVAFCVMAMGVTVLSADGAY